MPRTAEVALPARATLGEGPTWDDRTGRLVWVDILACRVHTYDPATGADTVVETPQHVGAAKPRAGGGLVLNLRDGVGLLDPDGAFRWLTQWPVEGRRGNDAAVDAAGRLWAGTMAYDVRPGGGRLNRVEADGSFTTVLDDVTISNGTGWSPDGTLMYYIDTPLRRIDVFDVEPGAGTISNRRTLAAVTRGQPDGLTVDADGCVWVALWDGGGVHRYTPEGELDQVIDLPASRVTACAFGGPDLTDLYVTTASEGLSEAVLAVQPDAGSLFVVPGAGAGLPSQPFAG
ncbi:SMP-30/gluconolactonase/LRE family protein [Thermopolyspora sp. NPDC052614]|uniref:SMP-30/gluconolactonase/LRE family protein n=1 Tax=Thermopolyspora sp. NPDC052614 TaxID=3155682 RepID=UPI0034440ED4